MQRLAKNPVTVRVVNAIIFYVGWFILLVGAVDGWAGWASVALVPMLALHVALVRDWRKEMLLMLTISGCGLVIDSLYIAFGVVGYASPNVVPWLAPWWIVVMYGLFATSVDSSLHWMGHHLGAAAVLGGVGAAVSYAVGVKMGAASFLLAGGRSPVLIGFVWTLFMPMCIQLSRFLQNKLHSKD